MNAITLPRSVVEQALDALQDANTMMEHRQDVKLRHSAMADLRAALEQPQDHTEQNLNMVPAGWKLVPVDPNMSMTQSALKASRRWAERDAPLPRGQELWAAGVCWQAMLAAAPQPPTAEKSSGVEQPQSVTDCHQSQPQGEQKASWYHKHWGDGDDVFYSPTDGIPEGATPLYTRPQTKREPLTEMEIVELRQLTPGTLDVQFVKFARSIEAAHGVKGRK